jgi:hypothetical protein
MFYAHNPEDTSKYEIRLSQQSQHTKLYNNWLEAETSNPHAHHFDHSFNNNSNNDHRFNPNKEISNPITTHLTLCNNSTTDQFLWILIELRLCEEISDSAITIKVIGAREVMLHKYRMEQVVPASIADKPDISLANALNDEPNPEPMRTSAKHS